MFSRTDICFFRTILLHFLHVVDAGCCYAAAPNLCSEPPQSLPRPLPIFAQTPPNLCPDFAAKIRQLLQRLRYLPPPTSSSSTSYLPSHQHPPEAESNPSHPPRQEGSLSESMTCAAKDSCHAQALSQRVLKLSPLNSVAHLGQRVPFL